MSVLLKRFILFRDQVEKCDKVFLKMLFNICQYDASSVTGANFRKLMLLCNRTSIEDISPNDIDSLTYQEIPNDDHWRIDTVKELINVRQGHLELPGFTHNEVEHLLTFTCVT